MKVNSVKLYLGPGIAGQQHREATMLDGVIIGLPVDGIKVLYKDKYVSPRFIETYQIYESPVGGSKMTIGIKKGKLVIKGNPVSWLTAQNVHGSNNAWALVLALLANLKELRILKIEDSAWNSLKEGNFDIHQLAFNKYLRVVREDKSVVMDLLKSIFGSLASNTSTQTDMRWIMYTGLGMIINNRTVNLTMYDKREQLARKAPDFDSDLVPDLDFLHDLIRVEVTVKYGYFSTKKRRMSWWRNKDWDEIANDLLVKTLKDFGVDYVIRCPNIYDPNYIANWRPQDRKLFESWLRHGALSKLDAGKLRRRYAFNAGINERGHRNILWALSRPKSLREPVVVDLVNTTRFPGKDILSSIYPLADNLTTGASTKTLRLIDKACGLRKAQD
jgi:hypothetical protein